MIDQPMCFDNDKQVLNNSRWWQSSPFNAGYW